MGIAATGPSAPLPFPEEGAVFESFDAFTQAVLAAGYDAAVIREWSPDTVVENHVHPFHAAALVVHGEMWLTVAGVTRHLRPGDRFSLPPNCLHSERYGPHGAIYWVARHTGQ